LAYFDGAAKKGGSEAMTAAIGVLVLFGLLMTFIFICHHGSAAEDFQDALMYKEEEEKGDEQ
jgi:hypothetical protein